MANKKTLILDGKKVKQKVKRIAFEIYENNFQEKEIILVGIASGGYTLAQMLTEDLKSICSIPVKLVKLGLDKEKPLSGEIELDIPDMEPLSNKTIILIDDVLNTGRTLAYGLKPLLNVRVKKIETAALVNRSLTEFPISCKYTGYELATTINEHVQVILDEEKMGVYLH